ncbi:carbohydrate-binding module family 67 protein [Amanita thiersii Skay4041]|uniref:Carbohydrate-binding module family 67 protein n=1 Tax=Amanita thiersii Skay4041 TaxID=703135 RepID=A0A2A9NK78_9AGAR|nr:carbohydrate-binding module family 67 protein [Amanita thiersii Skay4041]
MVWDVPTTNTTQPPGIWDFRGEFYMHDKRTVSTEILITADDTYILYLNKNQVGTSNDYTTSQRYCIRSDSRCNVFAVRARNKDGVSTPAGVLAVILITYMDGTNETTVTDTNWRAHTDVSGFEPVDFDDSNWSHHEVNNGSPPGARTFHKTVQIPSGQRATSGTVMIGADDEYTLYVNGKMIESAHNYAKVQRCVFDLPSLDIVVLAVATNNSAIEFETSDCACLSNVEAVSGVSFQRTPEGLEQPWFDDSNWPIAAVEGQYGAAPWGPTPVEDSVSKMIFEIEGAPVAEIGEVIVP